MPISGGKIIKSGNIRYDLTNDGRLSSLKITYKVNYGTYFEVDGDLTSTLEVEGSLTYVKDWIHEKLRKMENGQMKVVKSSSERKRDWKQEEEIRKKMWEDVNINGIPKGHAFEEIVCYQQEQTQVHRPPSPSCKIS